MNDTENDIEAQLLAAHGAVTADASHYEESVIRDAKLRSAPQITLPHATIANKGNVVTCCAGCAIRNRQVRGKQGGGGGR